MPIEKYDSVMGNAAKTLRAMRKKYGYERGTRIFYATVNKRKKRH